MRNFVAKTISFTLVASQFFLSSVSGDGVPTLVSTTPRKSPLNAGYELDETAKDVLRYCKESCTDSCVECSHPILCDTEAEREKKGQPKENATEIFCGMHPKTNIVGNVYCPANQKCVPKGWNCKFKITNMSCSLYHSYFEFSYYG